MLFVACYEEKHLILLFQEVWESGGKRKILKAFTVFFFNAHLKNYFKVGNMTEFTKIMIITKHF